MTNTGTIQSWMQSEIHTCSLNSNRNVHMIMQ